jgi:hypothetical protein
MTIDSISNLAIRSGLTPISYYYSSGTDGQKLKQDRDISSVKSSSSGSISSISDKLNLSAEAQALLSSDPGYISKIAAQQPQLMQDSPVNKSQNSFKTILQSKQGLTEEELTKSINNRKKYGGSLTYSSDTNASSETAKSDSGGYILSIPQDHLEEMKSYDTQYALRNKLYDTFNAYQNSTTGTLVDLIA